MNVNILVGRFQPLTAGHIKCVEYLSKNVGKNLPTIICMIETKGIDKKTGKIDPKRPFPTELFIQNYKDIISDSAGIEDIELIKSADIVKIKEQLEPKGYNIVSWTCGSDRFNDYKRMVDRYAPEIELIEIPRTDEDISATKARTALMEDDEEEFLRLFIPLKTIKQKMIYKSKDLYNKFKQYVNK